MIVLITLTILILFSFVVLKRKASERTPVKTIDDFHRYVYFCLSGGISHELDRALMQLLSEGVVSGQDRLESCLSLIISALHTPRAPSIINLITMDSGNATEEAIQYIEKLQRGEIWPHKPAHWQ